MGIARGVGGAIGERLVTESQVSYSGNEYSKMTTVNKNAYLKNPKTAYLNYSYHKTITYFN
jgi:hypothetical protein